MSTETADLFTARPSEGRDVEPVDYAAINGVYLALLGAVVVVTHRRRTPLELISGGELVPMAAATFALSKVVAREKIGTWVREPFVDEHGDAPKPRGRRLRRAVGELVTCTRCMGAWSALAIVGLRVTSPDAGRLVTNLLAVSAANDWMQAGFRYVAGKANAANP